MNWLLNHPRILLLIPPTIWAGNTIIGKVAIGHISPFTHTSFRWLIAICVLLPFAYSHIKRDWHLLKPHLLYLTFLAASGFTIFNNLLYSAVVQTSAVNAAIVQASLPLFIFLLNFFIFKINTTIYQILGFPLTLIGVCIIASQGSWQVFESFNFNFGDILIITAIAFYAAFSVFLKSKPDTHWMSFIFTLAVLAFLISIPFTAYEIATSTNIWPDLKGIAIALFTGICVSIVAHSIWIKGIELIGANSASFYVNLIPVFGTLLAIFALGEPFKMYHGIGMALIFGGVLLAQKKQSTQIQQSNEKN